MDSNIETVFSLKEKSIKEIKSWLTDIVTNKSDFREELKDFNILLLSECVNSKIFESKTLQEELEWASLYIYILLILDDVYQNLTHPYIVQSIDLRIEMIKKYGSNPKKDILDFSKVKDWIKLEEIKLSKIEDLSKLFSKKRKNKYFININ